MWYHRVIGGKRCPIVDTWWQTETGGIMITPLPGAVRHQARLGHPALPGHRRRRSSTRTASAVKPPDGGFLAIQKPWPGMLRGIWGDPERFQETYWSKYEERPTSPATAPTATRTATSGSWAASTT